jgi:hypothetical protein
MIDFLVFSALAAAAAFVAAWCVSPKLRRWMEQPKYSFQARLDEYSRSSAK